MALTPQTEPSTAAARVSILEEPKIDCHCHVLDPARFPYRADTPYRPSGQEIGTAAQMEHVFAAYGIRGALVVGPNSGYEEDNRCLLDAIAGAAGRWKGIAVVPHDVATPELERLKARGIVGVAFNATFHGADHYRDTTDLLARLAALDMCVSLQVERDQLVALAPMLERSGVRVLIDHCGRPSPAAGIEQPGFRELLRLAGTGRVYVKLSGYLKWAGEPYPDDVARPYVGALLEAFTPRRCLWASDWPFLRAETRVDIGPLLLLFERLVPRSDDRHEILWATPCRLLGFAP